MSVKIMTAIWEHSEQKGSHRLVLLAIADNANDEGVCWPSIDTIANKCRLTDRYVRKIISDLIGDGELISEERPGTSNVYRVGMNYSSGVGMNGRAGGYERESIPTPEQESRGGMNGSSAKPSINHNSNHQESSDGFQAVVNAYENNIGLISSQSLSDKIKDAVDTYPFEWIVEAIGIASKNKARSWKYIQTVLDNWRVEGRGDKAAENKTVTAWEEVRQVIASGAKPTFTDNRILEAVRPIWPELKAMTTFTERELRMKFERNYNAVN